ncbi:EAL domain-containing protein [Bacillus taeanensis]|uniref:Diguanylate phosphodiesterase n=1 Tax=Bacillus taeanensis TaxID=273032 RepID=A0A366XZB5_9BACI|nr:EAL domain-containing protein [Bacillus taeanensis]RBW69493.1 diguanylate phosphodiesterase [Bacillus taeanensis]
MDALDIISNIEQTKPYFQPIISAEEQAVIGYEVLGRIETKKGVESLGFFFHDETVPDEYRLEVDDYIREKAIQYILKDAKDHLLLFLNFNVNLLMLDRGEAFLTQLNRYKDHGLDFSRIVVEITEHDYSGDIHQLCHLINYFKALGIKVAVDDIGKGASNLDRIGLLKPDILKVDLEVLNNPSESHRDILYSLAMLARKIGASLLYEGVEDILHLNYAWRNGGRYYQGYYLARPKENFVDIDFCKQTLGAEFHQFILHEKTKIEAQYKLSENLNTRLVTTLKKVKHITELDQTLVHIAEELSDLSFRLYICNEDGFQESANVVKQSDQTWALQPNYKNKNWSWRPYFLENIARMNYEKKGILSDLYSDIETDEIIRTYSFPMDNGLYLFIDISYAFLYEQDGLLE